MSNVDMQAQDGGATDEGQTAEDQSAESTGQVDVQSQITALMDSQRQLTEQIGQLAALQGKQQPAQQQKFLSEAEMAELWKNDPYRALKETVKMEISGLKNEVTSHTNQSLDKTFWDNKARADFPVNDKQFQNKLRETYAQLSSDGFVDPNSPKALYLAAEMTALRMGTKPQQSNGRQGVPAASGEAPRAVAQQIRKSPVSDDHPAIQLYKQMNPEATKERIDAMKARIARKAGIR